MKIMYRPVGGSLAEAMKRIEVFDTLKELVEILVKKNALDGANAFNAADLSFRYYGYDSRIDWETFLVCTDRFFGEKYHSPSAIGYMCMKKEKFSKGFVVFGCRKCDHRVYAEQAPNFHDKLYKLSGLACPSCGEEGLQNWVLLGTADEYEGSIYASKPIENEEREYEICTYSN